jgi:hypothetical protein
MTKKKYLINLLKKEIKDIEDIIKQRILINNDKFNLDYYNVSEFDKLMNKNNWDFEDRENQNFDIGQISAYNNALKLIEKHVL